MSSLIARLKRRHLYRVAVAYAAIGWLLIQVVTQTFPVFSLPSWTEQLAVLLVALGFPIALVLAWAHEPKPADIGAATSNEPPGVLDEAPFVSTARRPTRWIVAGLAVLAIALGAFGLREYARRDTVE